MEKLERYREEKLGWLEIAGKSMNIIWDNKKDDEVWNKYIEIIS